MPPATFYYEKNDAYDALVSGDDAVFESNVRLFVFAAALGYAQNRRVPDPDDNGEIRWSYIGENQRLFAVSASLGYAATDDPEAIISPEIQIEVLSEYAAGGARLLVDEVVDAPGENLDNLVSFLRRNRDEEQLTEQVGILEEIEKEVGRL
jgi:dnd system-associated protein 4